MSCSLTGCADMGRGEQTMSLYNWKQIYLLKTKLKQAGTGSLVTLLLLKLLWGLELESRSPVPGHLGD